MKNSLKLFTVLSIFIFSVFYSIGFKPTQVIQATFDHNTSNCGYNCPIIHFNWTSRECPASESAYTSNNDDLQCKKKINGKWRYADKVSTNHSVDVAYDKSHDPTKCHRPSDNDLKDVYGMDHDARDDFKDDNDEWMNATPIACPTSVPTTIPTTAPTSVPTTVPTSIPTAVPTIIPTKIPTAVPTKPESCEGEECPSNTPVPTQPQEITNTPTATPTNSPNVGGGNPSNPGPYVCNDADPGAPTNLTAVALGGGKVRLTWSHSPGPHTSYAVAYGPSIGNYIYGDPNVGNVTTYTVSALTPGAKYCFYVQAQNGCKGGVPSNVVCTNPGVGGAFNILGVNSNYNPLVEGIRESYGGAVLGASTELMATAEVVYSTEKLPSGNTLDNTRSINIAKIGVDQPIYLPQKIGDDLTVGHQEVLSTNIDGTTVYYGHNGYDVFGSLYQLRNGDSIKINDLGVTSNYNVTSTQFVHKSDVGVIKSNSDQIVLVTCSYTQPDYRIIVKAFN